MSEQTAPTEGTEETNEQATEFEPVASQEALDKIIQGRIARERAKFADYDELKASADKLAQIEEANKSEVEKVAERLAAAEKRAVELEAKAARAEVAAAKGVPVELLSGGTLEELEASADALIAFKGEAQNSRLFIPNEGNSPSRQVSSESEFVKELFSSGG